LLPDSVLKKRKGGFTPPLRDWLVESLKGRRAEDWLSKDVLQAEFFGEDQINTMLMQHCTRVRDWTVPIFMLMSFDIWHRIFIQRVDDTDLPRWSLRDVGLI